MRIGFDAKRAYRNRSGLGNYSRSTVDLLAKYFQNNDYFLFSQDNENPENYQKPEKAQLILPKTSAGRWFGSYWRSFKIFKRADELKLDVYHGLSNELPYKIDQTVAKNIVTIHDLIFLRFPELYKPADRKIYIQKSKYACEIADTIIAISEQTKTDILKYFDIEESKIQVVYQGCNPIFYKEIAPASRINVLRKYGLPTKYLLNIGTVERRKNALLIVKAVHLGKIDLPVVIIGGRTDYQAEIEAYVAENQLSERVFIYNDVPFEDFPAIYQHAEMFVYPSHFEGFGIPIIEALNSKVPVITTKGGCFSEAGGFSTLYIDSEKWEDLAEKINFVLSDEDQRQHMIAEGYKYVQKFSEDKVAQNLMNVYLK